MLKKSYKALLRERMYWRYYLAPYIGAAVYLILANLALYVGLIKDWHVANACGLIIGYLVTFYLRKHWFGSRDLHQLHVELVKYSIWYSGFFLLSVVGAYILVEYMAVPNLLAQIIMSVITSLMGRQVISSIFSGGLSHTTEPL